MQSTDRVFAANCDTSFVFIYRLPLRVFLGWSNNGYSLQLLSVHNCVEQLSLAQTRINRATGVEDPNTQRIVNPKQDLDDGNGPAPHKANIYLHALEKSEYHPHSVSFY